MTYKVNDNGVNRDATADEIANIEQIHAAATQATETTETAAAAQAAAKTSAQTKLAALGLTADEIAAL